MKYSEAKNQIGALSSKYRIDMGDGDFNVRCEQVMYDYAYVDGSEQYRIDFYSDDALSKIPSKDKLYMILVELAMTPPDERAEEKKQYVKVFNKPLGYLNIDSGIHDQLDKQGNPFIESKSEYGDAITKFTDKEIEQLKQHDDIPLDWNKVTLEEANED